MIAHNQYCLDDWEMYHGDGPRGMGPAVDGCVCILSPEPEPKPYVNQGDDTVNGSWANE